MTNKSKLLAGVLSILLVFLGWKHFTYEPGYCPSTRRLITDAEFVKIAIEAFEGEVRSYGGFDGLEKHFIDLNRRPEEAGRSFDANAPGCCTVLRGRQSCGFDGYPVCVLLNFPQVKVGPASSYVPEGRSVFFDDCGNVKRYL